MQVIMEGCWSGTTLRLQTDYCMTVLKQNHSSNSREEMSKIVPLALLRDRAPRTPPTMVVTISRVVKKPMRMINRFRRYQAGLGNEMKTVAQNTTRQRGRDTYSILG